MELQDAVSCGLDQPEGNRFRYPALIVPLLLYAVLVCFVGFAQRDQINPDGIAYVRNALYLSQGKWADSVSGYWSPLLSWSIAPLLYFYLDGLYSARLALGAWGVIMIVGAFAFVRRCTPLAFPWDMVVVTLVALVTVDWATCRITPDLPLGAVLTWYFCLTARSDILLHRRTQFLAGITGGIAYLVKGYAFPFFLAHYSLTILLHFLFRRSAESKLQSAKAWLVGMLGFWLIAAPWVGVVSWKCGQLTIALPGRFNHVATGPAEFREELDKAFFAATPLPGRITTWETPEIFHYKDWSPLASPLFFLHQLWEFKDRIQCITSAISGFDLLGLVPGFLILMPVIRLISNRTGYRGSYPVAWTLMTLGIYVCGFLPTFFEPRYIEAVFWPMCCALCFSVFVEARLRFLNSGKSPLLLSQCVFLLMLICVASFAYHSDNIVKVLVRPREQRSIACREVGEKLRTTGCVGPIAACDTYKYDGMYVGYHALLPYLFTQKEASAAAVEKSLSEKKVEVFLVQ